MSTRLSPNWNRDRKKSRTKWGMSSPLINKKILHAGNKNVPEFPPDTKVQKTITILSSFINLVRFIGQVPFCYSNHNERFRWRDHTGRSYRWQPQVHTTSRNSDWKEIQTRGVGKHCSNHGNKWSSRVSSRQKCKSAWHLYFPQEISNTIWILALFTLPTGIKNPEGSLCKRQGEKSWSHSFRPLLWSYGFSKWTQIRIWWPQHVDGETYWFDVQDR